MKQDKITINGPKNDGTYIVEFKTADGVALAFSVPKGGGTAVLEYFPGQDALWARGAGCPTESVTGLLLARARRSEQYPLNHASSIDGPARLREITNLPLPMRIVFFCKQTDVVAN
jgi:hypothetical protein